MAKLSDAKTPWEFARDATIDKIEKVTAILAAPVEGFVVAKTHAWVMAAKTDQDTYKIDTANTDPHIFVDRRKADRLARHWNAELTAKQRATLHVEVLTLRDFYERVLTEAQQVAAFIKRTRRCDYP